MKRHFERRHRSARVQLTRNIACAFATVVVALATIIGASGCSSSQNASSTYTLVEDGKLTVASDLATPPFEYVNDSGKDQGFTYELMGMIADELGLELNYLPAQKFDGIIPMVKQGVKTDVGACNITITDERKQSWDFTDPYRTDHVGILVKKGSMSSMNDLDGKHIGVSQGSTTKDAITKMLQDNGFTATPQFDEYPDYPSINSALDAGQIDAFAMDRSTLKTYTTDDKELLQPEIEFGAQDYGIATKKGSDLSEVTEAVVKDVTSNGWIDEEIQTWGLL